MNVMLLYWVAALEQDDWYVPIPSNGIPRRYETTKMAGSHRTETAHIQFRIILS